MSNITCRFCHHPVPSGTSHHCAQMRDAGRPPAIASENNNDFLTSFIVGAVTDSTLIGTVIGGDIIGAALGDFFGGDD